MVKSASSQAFHGVLLYVESQGTQGGHIGLDGRSLCGIEKRFPRIDREQDYHDDEFAPWFGLNHAWICRACMRSYAKRAARPAAPNEVRTLETDAL